MTVYCTISLFLWYFGYLSMLSRIAVADQSSEHFYECIREMCWQDTNGFGTIADEPLANHITPDTPILINDASAFGSRIGDVVLSYEKYRPKLSSAVLRTIIFRKPNDTFVRYIEDPQEGLELGYMHIERPLPDPDSSFGSLGRDSLLADLPEGLRSAVDPAFLLPSTNKSCGITPTKCLVSVAVRAKIKLVKVMLLISLQSADVFYFGPDPTNTACLSTITSSPPTPTPPQVSMYATILHQSFCVCLD